MKGMETQQEQIWWFSPRFWDLRLLLDDGAGALGARWQLIDFFENSKTGDISAMLNSQIINF